MSPFSRLCRVSLLGCTTKKPVPETPPGIFATIRGGNSGGNSGLKPRARRNAQSDQQGSVKLSQLGGRQFADIVGQFRLLKAHESIALNRAFVLEAFGGAHDDLSR